MFIEIVNAASSWIDWTKIYALDDIVRVWIALVVLFSWMLAVFFFIWGWVMLILSGWKEDKTKPAINSIRYSIVWLIVIILAIFISRLVGFFTGCVGICGFFMLVSFTGIKFLRDAVCSLPFLST